MLATVNSLCVYTIYCSGNRFFKEKRIRHDTMFKTNMMGDDPMIKSKKGCLSDLDKHGGQMDTRTKGRLKTQDSNGFKEKKHANAYTKTHY